MQNSLIICCNYTNISRVIRKESVFVKKTSTMIGKKLHYFCCDFWEKLYKRNYSVFIVCHHQNPTLIVVIWIKKLSCFAKTIILREAFFSKAVFVLFLWLPTQKCAK